MIESKQFLKKWIRENECRRAEQDAKALLGVGWTKTGNRTPTRLWQKRKAIQNRRHPSQSRKKNLRPEVRLNTKNKKNEQINLRNEIIPPPPPKKILNLGLQF